MYSAEAAEAAGSADPAAAVLRAVTDAGRRQRHSLVVLIGGPSGAGKSTLADTLLAAWPGTAQPALVRLEDIYPGWHGLQWAGEHLTGNVLEPRSRGLRGRWQRYDWAGEHGAEWHEVDPARPLIVEGCGTLRAANVALSDVRVWLDASEVARKERALARDGAVFAAHWDLWQREWETWCARESPERHATIRLRTP